MNSGSHCQHGKRLWPNKKYDATTPCIRTLKDAYGYRNEIPEYFSFIEILGTRQGLLTYPVLSSGKKP
jgi:hypothetical protein